MTKSFKLNNKILIATAIVTLLLSFNLLAQQKVEFKSLSDKYPGENEIIISNETTYIIKSKQNKLEISQSNYSDNMILDQSGTGNYKEQFYSSGFTPVLDYSAYTIKADGSKVKTKLANVTNSTSSSIFYDDVKKTEITYTNLEPGARKILKTSKSFLDPALLHKFLFGSYSPAEKLSFSVEVDKGVEIGYKIFNDTDSKIKLKKEQKGSKTIFTWTAKNVKGYKFEDRQPSFLTIMPHIVIFIKSYPNDKGNQVLFGDVDRLFKHYGTYVDKLNLSIDSDLKKVTDEVIKEVESEEEKVKKIFYWVKDNIKYVAYENGYEGFIPREASFVCERKFGDCKDMASIITAMCNYAGIDKVKLAWIGSRDLPYTYNELPTPAVDNHMIAAYVNGESIIFLDATDQNSRYGLCSSFIQGKEALVRLNKNDFVVKKVPIVPAELNRKEISLSIVLEDDKIVGNGSYAMDGLARANFIARLEGRMDKRKSNYIESVTSLGNNKYQLVDYSEENKEYRDSTYKINFNFHLDNYVVSLGEETYINMFLKNIGNIEIIEDDRKNAIEHDFIDRTLINVKLDLDPSYKISVIPEPLKVENELLKFDARYNRSDNALYLEYEFTLKQILVEKKNFKQWNTAVAEIEKYMKESIALKRK